MKINLYGGPGIGKSTVATLIFAELKVLGINTELVSEYAKELVYEGIDLRTVDTPFQDRIFIEQLRRELLFHKKCELLITDSPLMLNFFYNKSNFSKGIALDSLKEDQLHFYLERANEDFQSLGRSHNQSESVKIDTEMLSFLKQNGVEVIRVSGDSKTKAASIVKTILEIINA